MTRQRLPDPPPMPTNDVRIAAAGTAAWAVALVVLLIVGLPAASRWWLWVCVAGVAIGLFAVWYIPRLQAGRAREEEALAARNEGATAEAAEHGPAEHGALAEGSRDAETAEPAGRPERGTAD